MVKKIVLGLLLAIPILSADDASAFPGAPLLSIQHDVIEVRGGHGGHGRGWGRGHGHRAFGWSRGRKVGWRGHHCPPGLWKKGWC